MLTQLIFQWIRIRLRHGLSVAVLILCYLCHSWSEQWSTWHLTCSYIVTRQHRSVWQCSWLHTSVRKWRTEFDFDVQNFHCKCHRDTVFSQTARQKVALWSSTIELSLQITVSQLARVIPLTWKQSVHARSLSAARFQNATTLLCWLNKGKKQSFVSMASSKDVVETPQYKLYYQHWLLLGL